MASQTSEALVGGAVLAAALGFVLYAGQSAGLSLRTSEGYNLSASFRSAEGVTLGTDVRLAGVKIGTVTGLDLNPETYRAQTQLRLDQAVQVPDDSAVVISSEGLLGGNFVEIMPGGSPFYFEPGSEIEDTQGSVSLISLLLKFVSGGGSEGE
ncbi:outer membrane lipid asymmetry maintenance protein MlaD [Aquicoccus sp. SCR17]|nr:outer membrane lipid asymmetry maintenance protein MlaD [Carideicomes alvinocaridis]